MRSTSFRGDGGWQRVGQLESSGLAAVRDRWSSFRGRNAAQPQHKFAALPELGARPHLAFVGLHDLIDDRQAQARCRLQIPTEMARRSFPTSCGLMPGPVSAKLICQSLFSACTMNAQRSAASRMARTAFSQKFQNTCLSLSPSARVQACAASKCRSMLNASVLRRQPVLQQRQRVFQQRHQIHFCTTGIACRGSRPGSP